MQVSLSVVGGIHDGRRIAINVPEFLIGRDPKCHLRPASNDVSRLHCAIVLRNGIVFLRDYGSSNGTYLNKRMLVHGELQLEDGDSIQVGPLTFKLLISAEPETKRPHDDKTHGTILHPHPLTGDTEDLEPSPSDTVLIAGSKKPKNPGDAGEVLCP
jgi:pSer/pThr/pTyr-binding forkhead associated (FHA) protein